MNAAAPRLVSQAVPIFRAVLVVVAHPDDESFGLGAVVTTMVEHGARVDLLCLTKGEASTLGADLTDDLASRRAEELRAAARELGIHGVEQRYYPDGALGSVPPCLLAAEVFQAVEDHDVLLVFDEGGITGHPDHQAATDAALAAADELRLPVLAWVVKQPVAEMLNAEFGLSIAGRDETEADHCFTVDRTRQLRAIKHHASQSDVNPVVRRRLELAGDTECVRYLRHPSESRRTLSAKEPCCEVPPAGQIVVTRAVLDAIIGDCVSSYPSEVCGLVAGRDEILLSVIPIPNVARPEPGECGFLMDGAAQFHAMREIDDRGLDLAGIYHSHPHDAAVPSEGDIRLAAYPGVAHIVVSVAEPTHPEVRAWRIENGVADELRIRVAES